MYNIMYIYMLFQYHAKLCPTVSLWKPVAIERRVSKRKEWWRRKRIGDHTVHIFAIMCAVIFYPIWGRHAEEADWRK